jgi:hypothetical protein
MKEVGVTVANVNPHEFTAIVIQLRAEGFNIVSSSIDGFTAILGGLKINVSYVRNQNVVNAACSYSEWQPGMTDQFLKDNLLRVFGKEDATGKVQPNPLATPINPKTGAVIIPPKPTTTLGTAQLPQKPATPPAATTPVVPAGTPVPPAKPVVPPPVVTPKAATPAVPPVTTPPATASPTTPVETEPTT